MKSKFRMFNLCVLKRIQWSSQALEVSWTLCSMWTADWAWHKRTDLIFLHAWAKVIRRVQQPHKQLSRFNLQTLRSRTNRYPCGNVLMWLSLFCDTEIQIPVFCQRRANIMVICYLKMDLKLPTPFLSQPQKSPDISLLQGFLRHGEFRWRKRRKTITNLNLTLRPCHDPTSYCHLQWESMISICQAQSNKKFCKVQL